MARTHGAATKRQTGRTHSRTSTKPQLDYSVRYGNNYSKECAIAHSKLEKYGSLCCCCLKQKFDELHHAKYGGNNLGDNWFPVCERCHTEVCHNLKNWIKDKQNPIWGNQNTEEFTKRLRLGYQLLYSTN
ncbi:MAG: hypothetical protein RMY28_009695 [Nostoc sp. ChiSLP01]|nr:hypothetical protein [Nostoc sp. CmiSLP01]MDZ8285173.1 hypothetical protein [Nostoc sp. ChiSLP01]